MESNHRGGLMRPGSSKERSANVTWLRRRDLHAREAHRRRAAWGGAPLNSFQRGGAARAAPRNRRMRLREGAPVRNRTGTDRLRNGCSTLELQGQRR